MPLSISFPSGEATYYLLEKALNGLRDASLAWLQLLTFTVEHVECRPLVGFLGAVCVWWTDCKGWS